MGGWGVRERCLNTETTYQKMMTVALQKKIFSQVNDSLIEESLEDSDTDYTKYPMISAECYGDGQDRP